ncbi:uncharacterized protein LOC111045790 [Nilaparvata lugens]|uniref:uncharacterized protein LOC111045790 n=1 Tax=Nilaparvata lugens TaxID=108931 RepID=UPI00193CC482|nr:uncharacterized protein LOC111045790 [Nilaparvata lugens]
MDFRNMLTFISFTMIIMTCSFRALACDEELEAEFYEMPNVDEIMKTSEQIGFRPLFRHRQLMEERNRLKQERLDELNRRSNTRNKVIYGDFKSKKYQPPPYTITYITWNRNNIRNKAENKRKPPSSDQIISNRPRPYFYTSTNNNYYPSSSGQLSGNRNWPIGS